MSDKNMSEGNRENPEYQLFESKNYFDKELYLITMSDIIYRNKLGKYKTLIDEEFIKDRLG